MAVAVLVGLMLLTPGTAAASGTYPDTPEAVIAAFARAVNAQDRATALQYVSRRGPGPDAYADFGRFSGYQLMDPRCEVVSAGVRICSFYVGEPAAEALLRRINGRWKVSAILGENPYGLTYFPPTCVGSDGQSPVNVRLDRAVWLRAAASSGSTTIVRLRKGSAGRVCPETGAKFLPARFGNFIGSIPLNVVHVDASRTTSRSRTATNRFVGLWTQHMGDVELHSDKTGTIWCRDCLGPLPVSNATGDHVVHIRIIRMKGSHASARITASDAPQFPKGKRLRLVLKSPGLVIPALGNVGKFCDTLHQGECGA